MNTWTGAESCGIVLLFIVLMVLGALLTDWLRARMDRHDAEYIRRNQYIRDLVTAGQAAVVELSMPSDKRREVQQSLAAAIEPVRVLIDDRQERSA